MPQATNLTIANNAAVAKTFTLVSPASDGNVSSWELKEGAHRGVFPKITALARPMSDNSRRINIKWAVPTAYTDTATGLTKAGSVAYGEYSAKMPNDYPETAKLDYIAYVVNGIATALLKEMARDCTSAT